MTRNLLLVAVLLASCSAAPFAPDIPAPSEARIRELARRDLTVIRPELPFRVTVTPAVILAGSATWVMCFIPRSVRAHSVEWGIPGVSMSGEDISRIEFRRLIERVPCGNWEAVCLLSDGQRRHAQLTARGDCNTGDPR